MAVNALKQLSSSVMLKVKNRFKDWKSTAGFPIAAPKKNDFIRLLSHRGTAPFRDWGECSAP